MKKLLQSKGGELVNYDYFDVAEGTGIKNFYGGQSAYAVTSGSLDAITKYFLTTDNTIYSNKIAEKTKTIAGEVWQICSDVNYDVQFNLPKTIYGQARCSLTQGGVVAANITQVMVTTSLFKVTGGTSTLMASGATIPLMMQNVSVSGAVCNIPYDLTGQKWNFKSGDILRLAVQLWVSGSVTTNYVGYGCDPADRDDIGDASGAIVIPSSRTTQLKLQVPFKLDL